jgi:hypothetical protein
VSEPEYEAGYEPEVSADDPLDVSGAKLDLSIEQETAQEINKFSEGFEERIKALKFAEVAALQNLYNESQYICCQFTKFECAICWEVQHRAPDRQKKKAMSEFGADIGLKLRTVERKAQIWDWFFQEQGAEELTPNGKAYAFDMLRSPEIWFRTAIKAAGKEGGREDAVQALEMAQEKFEEAKTTGKDYTTRDFESDIGVKPQMTESKSPCPCRALNKVIVKVRYAVSGQDEELDLLAFLKGCFGTGDIPVDSVEILDISCSACGTQVEL